MTAATSNWPTTPTIWSRVSATTPVFCCATSGLREPEGLYKDFAGLPVRKVIRATRFYSMLLQRLKNTRSMDDGILWSAQADFMARLAEWDKDNDDFLATSARGTVGTACIECPAFRVAERRERDPRCERIFRARSRRHPGLNRARARIQAFDEKEIDWQIEVIRESTRSLTKPPDVAAAGPAKLQERPDVSVQTAKKTFAAEADRIAEELSRCAIRRGPGAAWIGLDWLGDAEVFQLVCLGPDLYNGVSGYRVVSCRACSGYGTAIVRRTRARRCGASSKKPEKPQCGADGPLSRRRRRYGPRLDRLCAHA